eukprot:scaffold3131_cov23-Cyclotella_meneghiniana.AAC.1
MVVEDELKSQPCLAIFYTNGERLEELSCYELLGPVQTLAMNCLDQFNLTKTQSVRLTQAMHISSFLPIPHN